MDSLLEILDLIISFYTYRGIVKAVDRVNLKINVRESIGLVGETGCGKSVTARAILRLIDPPGRIEGGQILFQGEDILKLAEPKLRRIRGHQISFIFQEPQKALDPTCTVGDQIEETVQISLNVSRKEARTKAVEILNKVGLADAVRLMKSYSFELSGGMAQRVMIGMAICGRPKLIIADEPTSALDVSIQAQILILLRNLYEEFGSSLLLITHDLGVAAENCDQIAVMYAGRIVELGPVEDVFIRPAHPYTFKLLGALPAPESKTLASIPGMVPDLISPPSGCRFSNRCDFARPVCNQERPPLLKAEGRHYVACFTPLTSGG